jgi:AmiR/NasT family two-component response regulator
MTLVLPKFRDMEVLIVHPDDKNVRSLSEQLKRLEARATQQWPPAQEITGTYDALFFDVDRGFDGMFPWRKHRAPMPTVAMIGSETPGRLDWVISQKPCAYILKPIGSQGAFQALTIAFHTFAEEAERSAFIETLLQRLHARPFVVRAILRLMKSYNISDDEAFAVLRSASMRLRLNVERYAQMVDEGAVPELVDLDPGNRACTKQKNSQSH